MEWKIFVQCKATMPAFTLNGMQVTVSNPQCEREEHEEGEHYITVNRNAENDYYGEPLWFPRND